MDKLLISKADIAAVIEDLPAGLLEKRLNPYIRRVQETQLPKILTLPVYDAMAKAFRIATDDESIESRWYTLWQEKAFRNMLAYLSWAEYLPFAQSTITSNSVVAKQSEYSEPVDAKIIGMMVHNTRNAAAHYVAQVQAFLATRINNVPMYPEYRTACGDSPKMPGLSTIVAL